MHRTPLSFGRKRRSRLLFGLALLLGLSGGLLMIPQVRDLLANPNGPQATDRQISLVVSQLLHDEHLRRTTQSLDDTIAERSFDKFIESIDPMKVYFYQSDIDEFAESRDELDDMVRAGDISFGHTVFNRFLKRLDERIVVIGRLLKAKLDFTLDEEIIIDKDKTTYPKNADEAYERWRKRIKYDLLVIKANHKDDDDKGNKKPDKDDGKTADEKARDRLSRRYKSFANRMHQTNSDDVLEMFLSSLTSSLDPHTTYMSKTTLDNFKIELSKALDGIGAALQPEDGYTVVSRIVPGGAADKAGDLKPQDRIVGVGQGTDGEFVDVVDMRLSDVVKLIRGKKGTVVRLEVIPGGDGAKKIYQITRAKIELVDQIARGEIVEQGEGAAKIKVGVINLPSFYMDMRGARLGLPNYRSTTRDCRKILRDFKSKGVDVVVMDLRNNGGGSLIEAITLTGLFIDRGPVVQVKDGKGVIDHYDDREAGEEWDGPLVVMISKFSASASEIFAGAVKDYKRGLIVGDHSTHGKGTVQSLLYIGERLFGRIPNAPNLGALKITMQQFYRPNGESTQKRGVLADVELPSIITHLKVGESDLDYAIAFDKIDPLPMTMSNLVNLPMKAKLQTRSKERCEKSEKFAVVRRRIKRYLDQRDRLSVTLNEEKFLAERAEVNAEKELEKTLKEENEPDRPIIKKDFYFKEVMAVTKDYLDLLAHRDLTNQQTNSK